MRWLRWLSAVLTLMSTAVNGHLDLFMNKTETKRLLGEYVARPSALLCRLDRQQLAFETVAVVVWNQTALFCFDRP